jgi:hypothetical protein
MKKSAVKRYSAFAVLVGIILIVIGLLLHYSRPEPSMPSFSFLGGQKPAYHSINNSQTQYRTTQDIYSFEAEFNDVFPDANKELLALGFVDRTSSGSELWHRDYSLRRGPYELIRVRIYTKHKLSVYSTPKSSDYSSPDRHEFHLQDGWVSVTVSVEAVKWRIRFYSWLYRIFYIIRP